LMDSLIESSFPICGHREGSARAGRVAATGARASEVIREMAGCAAMGLEQLGPVTAIANLVDKMKVFCSPSATQKAPAPDVDTSSSSIADRL
jgi:hypothetical protein